MFASIILDVQVFGKSLENSSKIIVFSFSPLYNGKQEKE
jgi:hypothetical protein